MQFAVVFLLGLIIPQFVSAQSWTEEQVAEKAANAEETVRKAYDLIWALRTELKLDDSERDPDHTGVIGVEWSPLTTTMGYEESKHLSTKPGWAAWLVRDLAGHGIWEGADIAVSFTGSFPALNLAVLAALQEFDCDVKGIASVGASSYGANELGFSWPELERLLREEKILRVSCSAVTLGGSGDRGLEWDGHAMDLAMRAVKRSQLPLLQPKNLRDAIKKRMFFYGLPDNYYCYINVGGGQASLGGGLHQRFDRGGWFFEPMPRHGEPDGVVDRFLQAGIPVMNLLWLDDLNIKHGIIKE